MADLSQNQLRRMEGLFSALGSLSRLRLLLQLRKGEKSVTELTQAVSMSQPVTSHHLALLRRVDLVQPRRSGKQVFYRLTAIGAQALQLLAPLVNASDASGHSTSSSSTERRSLDPAEMPMALQA